MATITNAPTIPTAPLLTLPVGTWCLISDAPNAVFCVTEQVGAFTSLVFFTGTQDCIHVKKTNSIQATAIAAPSVTLAF